MTPIEWMALIVVVVALIKIVVIMIKPQAWMSVVEKVYMKPIITAIVSLVLGYFSLTYLLDEITIVQIFAVMLFFVFLMGLSLAVYSNEIVALGRKMLKDKKLVMKAWLPIIVWIVLSLWVLKEILGF